MAVGTKTGVDGQMLIHGVGNEFSVGSRVVVQTGHVSVPVTVEPEDVVVGVTEDKVNAVVADLHALSQCVVSGNVDGRVKKVVLAVAQVSVGRVVVFEVTPVVPSVVPPCEGPVSLVTPTARGPSAPAAGAAAAG